MPIRKSAIDWLLILIYLALVAIGFLAVYTADYAEQHTQLLNLGSSAGKQFIFIIVSLLIALLIMLLDTRFYTAFAYVIYAIILVLLLSTLGIGTIINGSKSWIRLGGFNLQPAEFAKFATCLAVAKYISSLSTASINIRQQFTAGLIIAAPTALIILQGDAGSALVFTALILALYREGLSGGFLLLGIMAVAIFIAALLLPFPYILGIIAAVLLIALLRDKNRQWRIIALYIAIVAAVIAGSIYLSTFVLLGLLISACLLSLGIAFLYKNFAANMISLLLACAFFAQGVDYVYNQVLKSHQRDRIAVILGKQKDNKGVGYNLNQSKIAIGSGGIWGKGWLEGTQIRGDFVPELHTDFVFCTIGEEFGFIGSASLVVLYLLLLIRLVKIAERQKSQLSRVYIYATASIFFFHAFINIGMTIGLVPVIGIPLPFISYGGSALLAFTILLFIAVKLDAERTLNLR